MVGTTRMPSVKPFVDEAQAIVVALTNAVGAGRQGVLTKKSARPLRARCLAWLDGAPVECKALESSWGYVVGALVRIEDVLRAGVSSIRKPRAAQELGLWMTWVGILDTRRLFALEAGKAQLYTSVCYCSQAVRDAQPYSTTLHAMMVDPRWNAVPFLGLMERCREGHRRVYKQMVGIRTDHVDLLWSQSFLLLAAHTEWVIPDKGVYHGLWEALAVFTEKVLAKSGQMLTTRDSWVIGDNAVQDLIAKIVHDMPGSGAQALSFVQRHPTLVSKRMFDCIGRLHLTDTNSMLCILVWLRLHASPSQETQFLQEHLRGLYPGMDDTLRSYIHMVPSGQEILMARTLIPAWRHIVHGVAPDVEEDISGDLFV